MGGSRLGPDVKNIKITINYGKKNNLKNFYF